MLCLLWNLFQYFQTQSLTYLDWKESEEPISSFSCLLCTCSNSCSKNLYFCFESFFIFLFPPFFSLVFLTFVRDRNEKKCHCVSFFDTFDGKNKFPHTLCIICRGWERKNNFGVINVSKPTAEEMFKFFLGIFGLDAAKSCQEKR